MSLEEFDEELESGTLTLLAEIETLSRRVWEGRLSRARIDDWLSGFADESEREHALYLLSQFMFFGQREVRTILSAVYEDLFRTPIIHNIRRNEARSLTVAEIERRFQDELSKTRFLGCGSPAESGYHLLYYFRQESMLWRELFVHPHELLFRADDGTERAAIPDLRHVVFIDDICGSGHQALDYYRQIVRPLKMHLPHVKVHYLVMIATEHGLARVRGANLYDRTESVFLLDESFRVFGPQSRYYYDDRLSFRKGDGDAIVRKYGHLFEYGPYGYADGQLLLGMYYNVPDNVLPIIWSDEKGWRPIFRRYPKLMLQEHDET
ncbi:hypothetical protein [Nannocystis sp. SCPEA4]|uniref:phosphoribosyltransferase-like protein n=1 Tax=Nannocystis sp. SCPEA4 TaxID=2996787 RepID=UPI00226DB19F|nr:hypothetical protein [Nannocystis sp. SCPEA4]MCY1053978.1 hypothetical protein [Nannocystis sp. SCPEA4]